jgi:hypothetical protein
LFRARHRADGAVRAVELLRQGAPAEDIASELGVSVSQIHEWSSELTWISLGYPQSSRRSNRRVVDGSRGDVSSDLARTSNIVVTIVGLEDRLGGTRVVASDRRIGEFIGEEDYWWSIQLGRLAREWPTVIDDPEVCRREMALGLDRAIDWLDATATMPALLDEIRGSPHLRAYTFDDSMLLALLTL